MRSFVDKNPKLHSMFMANNIDIVSVDTDGDGDGNHAVLKIAEKVEVDGKIVEKPVAYYDPWMKRGGTGQIINAHDNPNLDGRLRSSATIDDYEKATKLEYDLELEHDANRRHSL